MSVIISLSLSFFLSSPQSTYTDQIADLSVQKNKLSGDINAVLDEMAGLQEELSAVKLKHREAEGEPTSLLSWLHLSYCTSSFIHLLISHIALLLAP